MATQPQQNKQQKGGKKAKAEEPIVVKHDEFLSKVGRDLRNKNKKMDKIITFKKSMKKGDKAPDTNQQAMLDSEAPLKAEIQELKELVDLYKTSNPDWNVDREEAKKEEVVKANNQVVAAFTTFCMMHHVKKNASFFKEVSGKDKKAMNEIMASFRQAKKAAIGSHDVGTGAAQFAKLIAETDFEFVHKCYQPDSIAAAKAKAAQSTETEKITVAEPVQESAPEKKEEVKAEEPEPVVAPQTEEPEPAQAEAATQEAAEEPKKEHQPREERRGGRGGRGGRGEHRGGRGNNGERRGGYNRGPKTDDDGFMVATDRPATGQRRGGERRGRGGYNNNRGGAEGGDGDNFRRGGNRGGGRGRGEHAEAKPPTSDNQ